MARAIPRLESTLLSEIHLAQDLLDQFETARARQARSVSHPITIRSIDYAYELAFLNVFKRWEDVLEQCFVRILCGYENSGGVPTFIAGQTKSPTIAAAEARMLNGRDFLLWHNPAAVAARCRGYFVGHVMEIVVASKAADLEHYANVRHAIAHGQADARRKFDLATMGLAGRRYRGSSVGRFLRDWVPHSVPRRRWFMEIGQTLHGLAGQITR